MENSTQRDLKLPLILVSLSFSAIAFLLPIYSKGLGMSATEIGGIFSVVSFIILVLKPIMGKVSDKIGRKPLLVPAMMLYSLSLYFLAKADTVEKIYGIRMIQGIAGALLGITTYAMIIDTTEQNKVAQTFGKLTSYQTIGMLIGSGMSFFLLGTRGFGRGWYQQFMIFSVAAMGASIITLLTVAETREVGKDIERKKVKQKANKNLSSDGIKLLIITFILAMVSSMLMPILMVYLQDRFTKDFVGIALTFLPSMVLSSLLPSCLGKLSDRYGRVKMIKIGLMVNILAVGSIPLVNTLMGLTFLWAMDTIGSLIEGPARTALYTEIVGRENTGAQYGLLSSVRSLGTMIGPIVGGLLYDRITPQAPFYSYVIGLLLVLGFMSLFTFQKGIQAFKIEKQRGLG